MSHTTDHPSSPCSQKETKPTTPWNFFATSSPPPTSFSPHSEQVSIPVHHSAVALHKLGSLPYTGAASVFIKTLLNKKYSLPVPVIEGLVEHFKESSKRGDPEREGGGMPVLWHQAMLVFAERYKDSISKEGKNVLKQACKRHFHKGITPAVRRELFGYTEDENKM